MIRQTNGKVSVLTAAVLIAVMLCSVFALCACTETEFEPEPEPIDGTFKAMSYNVRTISLDLDSPVLGYDFWFRNRDSVMKKHFLEESPDICGMQEVTGAQLLEFDEEFTDYDYVGVPRDYGNSGEVNPIFYKTERFEVESTSTFWLSEDPDVPSRGWDAACNRICTYAILKDKKTGGRLAFFNTHLDHVGATARKEGIKLILQKIQEVNQPSLLTGDFNDFEGGALYDSVVETIMDDSKYVAKTTMDVGTYHGYGRQVNKSVIDYVFVTKDSFDVADYRVCTQQYPSPNDETIMLYPSDHYAVAITLSMPAKAAV